MKGYWMEMHCHSATGSGCAKVPPEEIPALYVDAGYSGLVATDHFRLQELPGEGETDYIKRVDRAVKGYHIMKEIAPAGFTVLLGSEMSLGTLPGGNHFLVYGLTEEFLYKSYCMHTMTLEEIYNYLHENGMLIYQAHPYRDGATPQNTDFLDGIEAFNNPRAKLSDNILSYELAKKYNKPMISGSDFHTYDACASGGVCFPEKINTNEDLLKALKKGDYIIKKNSDY